MSVPVRNQMTNTGASTGWGIEYPKMTSGIAICLTTNTSAMTTPRRMPKTAASVNATTIDVNVSTILMKTVSLFSARDDCV
jgi:hypothetical protein